MSQLYSNNGSSVLVEDLLPADTTINLGPGEGDKFPLPDAGDPNSFFIVTCEDVNANFEIMECTERSGDILTVIRGQESTSPAGFAIGSRCEARLTAGSMDNFKQVADQYSLRGDMIDSDGIRYWHQQDPSTYQFFQIRYYTADLFGIPVMHIEPPPSLPGLHFMAGVIAADGTQRVIRLGPDSSGDAPFPATGEVHFEVPGVMRWSHLTDPLGGNIAYASFASAEVGSGDTLYFNPQGPSSLNYRFYTQDGAGNENFVELTNGGAVSCMTEVRLRNPSKVTYSQAQDAVMRLGVNPFSPSNADWMAFGNIEPNVREFSFSFFTVTEQDNDPDPPTYIKKNVSILDGGVYVTEDPQNENMLTRRSWVESLLLAATSGPGLDAIAEAMYGRTELFINSSGTNDGSTQTLLGGYEWSDFYQVEILAKAADNIVSTRLDTESLINNGYSPTSYEIFQAQGTGGDVRKVYFNPKSLTTFTGTLGGGGSGGIISIVGIGIKVQPVSP